MADLGPYTWDFRVGRYRGPDGRLVPRQVVRDAIDRAIRELRQEARDLAEELRAGDIGLGEWEADMRAIVKDTHLLNTAAARGGWDQLTQSDYGRVGAIVRQQYNYLAGFAGEVQIGVQPLDGRLAVRAQMYADAGRATYEADVNRQQADVGAQQERSVLHPADHCLVCVEEAGKGWQPLGTLVPIGERTCLTNCQCTMDYR